MNKTDYHCINCGAWINRGLWHDSLRTRSYHQDGFCKKDKRGLGKFLDDQGTG